MRARRAIGVRPRLVATLILTSAITLAVAAVALLPPLQSRLRADELDTLVAVARGMRASFSRLEPADVRPRSRELARMARVLARRAGARVAVLDAHGRVLVSGDPEARDAYADARRAAARDEIVRAGGGDPGGELQAAVPAHAGGRRIVLALRRPAGDAPRAAQVVEGAFLPAALAALLIAAGLGLAISRGMLRRLKRLHGTALAVAESGGRPEVRAVPDPGRDEIGDLARALETMQEQLQREEEARRRFVATASHELRTPLHSLQMMLELLDDGLEDEETRLQVRRARDQTTRLAGLAESLLDLSRIDAGVPLRAEPVDVGEVCRAVVAEFGGPGARVELDVPPRACWARADPGAVAQVLRILLDNARRVTPAHGLVSVSVAQPNGTAEVAVDDDGPGVAEAERDAIFERFARGSAGEPDVGFGLGLAIGRELATRMEGELALARAEPGARFVIRLPAESPPLG